MPRPRLLDLFCGAGGAAMGYHRAGFDIIGVDLNPQPHYPFEFWQRDALAVLRGEIAVGWAGYDAIHASPPCQAYSTASRRDKEYPDLIAPVREALKATGLPWIIENVPPAPLIDPVTLCGSSFGLLVRRHRRFESNVPLTGSICDHRGQGQPWGVYGHGGGTSAARVGGGSRGRKAQQKDYARLMDMPWASPQEIVQAIPPAYTEFIGAQLLSALV